MSHLKGSGVVDFLVYLLRDERMRKICDRVLHNARVPLDVLKTIHLHAQALFAIGFYFLDAPRTCVGR